MKFSRANIQSVPVGGIVEMGSWLPDKIQINGMTLLKNGLVETNPAEYDNDFYPKTFVTGVLTGQTKVNQTASGSLTAIERNDVNDTLIAVGSGTGVNSAVFRSTDLGNSWVGNSSIITNWNNVRVIKCNGTQWIAVGSSGTIFSSENDGITWTQRTSGQTFQLNDAIWFNNQWIVVGNSNIILKSTDGISWSSQTVASPGSQVNSIASNGTIVAFCVANNIWSSTDGNTWNNASARVNAGTSISYGAGKWVFFGTISPTNSTTNPVNINGLAFSESVTTPNILPANVNFNFITTPTISYMSFVDGVFIVYFGQTLSRSLFYSTDGINWQLYPRELNKYGVSVDETVLAGRLQCTAVNNVLFYPLNTSNTAFGTAKNFISTGAGISETFDKFTNYVRIK